MKHRSNGRAFFVLSAIALAAFQGCARKGPSPDIVIAKDASWRERVAAAEIRRYCYLRTGDLPALREAESFYRISSAAVAALEKAGTFARGLDDAEAGEALSLKVLVLAKGRPESVAFCWREMGQGAFRAVPLENVAGGVYRLTLSAPAADIEYHLEVEADGQVVRFPATAPELNLTVVVLPVAK